MNLGSPRGGRIEMRIVEKPACGGCDAFVMVNANQIGKQEDPGALYTLRHTVHVLYA